MAIHTVNPGDRIKANDINQFVDIYQQNPTGNVFGTTRGVLLQSGNDVGISQFDNLYFKQVFETVEKGSPKVIVALGQDYSQAKQLLGVDNIYSVISGNAVELSDHSWYGYSNKEEVNISVENSSGFATTNISAFDDVIYGYQADGRKNGDSVKMYVFSTIDSDSTKKTLSAKYNIKDISITDIEKLAVKTNYSIQNIIKTKAYQPDYKQFDLRGVVDTRVISADGEEKKQYKWNAQWYSHYKNEEQSECYGVYFNNKEILPKDYHNITEGWTSISASEDWEDSISVDLDVYLNINIDLIRCKLKEQSPDEWEYNNNLTWWSVDLSALSSTGWYRRGSIKGRDPDTNKKIYSDGYLVETSYKIGSIKIRDDNVRIQQIFDGTQTYISPFYEELSTDSGDEAYEVPDSELSDMQLSSIERNLCVLTSMVSSEVEGKVVWDEISTKYNCWSFFDFQDPNIQKYGNIQLSADDDEDNIKRQFVIREYSKNDDTAIVRYAEISSLPCSLSGDANTDYAELSSIRRFNNDNGDYFGLYNFENPDQDFTLCIDFNKKHLDSKFKLLVRDDKTKTLRYADLSIDLIGSADLSALSSAISAISSEISAIKNDISSMSADMKTDSEVPLINLSSVQRYSYVDDNQQKHKAYMLYNFDNPDKDLTLCIDFNKKHLDSNFKLLVRDDKTKTLRYTDLSIDLSESADLSALSSAISAISSEISVINSQISSISSEISSIENDISSMSADIKTDSEIPLINLSSVQRYSYVDENQQPRKAYMLYNFDNPDNLQLELSDVNDSIFSRYKILVRDGNEGKLKYANFYELFVDSESTYEQYLSLEKKDNVLGLYKWTTDELNTLHLVVPDYMQYYGSGAHVIEPEEAQDYYGMDILVRNKNGGQHSLDYRKLSIDIPPFVHGDADDFVGQPCKSIESITNYISPDQSYYQLYNFSYPNATTVNNDLVSGDYYNLANGAQKNNEADKDDYFLIRNSEGILSYRKIYAKAEGGGGWDEQRILSIENSIDDIDNNIDNIRNDISNIVDDLRGDIESLSNSISGLSGNYWYQGGDSSTNYGSSIGDSNKNTVINLDGKTFVGNWTAAADFKVNGDITCDNDIFAFSVKGDSGSFNTIRSNNGGDITADNNIDMSNHEIKNISKIGDINLTDKQLVGNWITTGEHTAVGCINCDWVFKNDGSHNDGVNVGGLQLYGEWSTNNNFTVNGTLKIGNTTITETQLQQLLALLS